MRRYLYIGVLMLGGCASAQKVYGPDGNEYVRISCDGSAIPMSTCYKKALKVCPGGYYLAGEQNQIGPYTAAVTPDLGVANQMQYKSITIRCK